MVKKYLLILILKSFLILFLKEVFFFISSAIFLVLCAFRQQLNFKVLKCTAWSIFTPCLEINAHVLFYLLNSSVGNSWAFTCLTSLDINTIGPKSAGARLIMLRPKSSLNRLFAWSGLMIRNESCCNTVGLPKERNSYQSSPTFLCYESPTVYSNLHPSIIFSIPCDRIVERAYWEVLQNIFCCCKFYKY